MILDLVINTQHTPYYQRIFHGKRRDLGQNYHWEPTGGVEIYASEAHFLISAGGYWVEPPRNHGELFTDTDAGWAVPTTLMPTAGGINRNDFIRIEGSQDDRLRINTCVAPRFACGMNPTVPERYLSNKDCADVREGAPGTDGGWAFIDASGRCPAPFPNDGLYVAVFKAQCQSDECINHGGFYGFFEVQPADEGISFDTFRESVLHNNDHPYDWAAPNQYITASGHTIM
ncbi:hypothetical protein SE17_36895 [Kouleothrix aurantiaca]|uniref:Uncharacterized protein n=1 Tax=Kouleothrix aurantiaca TaxID=186479 RepID=A0A0P9D7Y1_9CHLR|nr:hypothetical protein SE17_36895 [Kouleothrix aurantiaca]